jgi:hypothetical protein
VIGWLDQGSKSMIPSGLKEADNNIIAEVFRESVKSFKVRFF